MAKQPRRESRDTDDYKDDVVVSYIHYKLIDLGYSISKNELRRKLFGRTSIEAVKDIKSKNQLNVTGTVDDTIDLIKRLTADIINNSSGAKGQKSSHEYNVRGTVRDENGNRVPNARVRVEEMLLRDTKLLGDTKTHSDGSYDLTYRAPDSKSKKKNDNYPGEFAIVVRALNSSGNGKEWLYADPIFKPKPKEVVDFMEGSREYKGESVYTENRKKILPLIGNVPLTALQKAGIEERW